MKYKLCVKTDSGVLNIDLDQFLNGKDAKEITLSADDEAGTRIGARVFDTDSDSTGIMLEGESNGRKFRLADAEMPSAETPDILAAHLYAGWVEGPDMDGDEYDAPIAAVFSSTTREELVFDNEERPRKKVYYDDMVASAAVWDPYSDNVLALLEHDS